jgi:hypothetical protein
MPTAGTFPAGDVAANDKALRALGNQPDCAAEAFLQFLLPADLHPEAALGGFEPLALTDACTATGFCGHCVNSAGRCAAQTSVRNSINTLTLLGMNSRHGKTAKIPTDEDPLYCGSTT